MRQRILNILVALDSFLWTLLTLGVGHPGETFSSAAYRAELRNQFYGKARPVIDWLFSWLEDNHCQLAYDYAYRKRNLPEDMR